LHKYLKWLKDITRNLLHFSENVTTSRTVGLDRCISNVSHTNASVSTVRGFSPLVIYTQTQVYCTAEFASTLRHNAKSFTATQFGQQRNWSNNVQTQ